MHFVRQTRWATYLLWSSSHAMLAERVKGQPLTSEAALFLAPPAHDLSPRSAPNRSGNNAAAGKYQTRIGVCSERDTSAVLATKGSGASSAEL